MEALNEKDVNWMAHFTRICNKHCLLINIVLQFQMLHLYIKVLAHEVLTSRDSERAKSDLNQELTKAAYSFSFESLIQI